MSDFNEKVIAEFRENDGKVEMFGDNPIIILHTIGAKSGEVRVIPLVTLKDGDDRYVFASRGGDPAHPDWYFNLKANPEIDIEEPGVKYRARMVELPADEAAARINEQAQIMSQFADYVVNAAPRVIPAFKVERV